VPGQTAPHLVSSIEALEVGRLWENLSVERVPRETDVIVICIDIWQSEPGNGFSAGSLVQM
jgi:hypothetical protein